MAADSGTPSSLTGNSAAVAPRASRVAPIGLPFKFAIVPVVFVLSAIPSAGAEGPG